MSSRFVTRYASEWPSRYKTKETKQLKSQQKAHPTALSCGCVRDYYPPAAPGSSVWCLGCERSATVRSAA